VGGGCVCLFVLSPALFTPWGFGPDYTNHLWLIWQQGLAISATGHPTLYLQTSTGIFEPLFGFYGGTLYAGAGAASALLGNHPYPIYVGSIGAGAALAYGGMWWIGRQLGLSRWPAHLPAFIFVTAAYYLTDIYARGAWTEFVALSSIPMFTAAGARLLTKEWRAGPVALFVLATTLLTGSHNITLFWSVVVVGPIVVVTWVLAGRSRPSLCAVAATAGLALVATGINAWFLALDLVHGGDSKVGSGPDGFFWEFTKAFDTLGAILSPLRHQPADSTTFGLIIVAPVAAFALSLVLAGLAWPGLRRAGTWLLGFWLILLAAMVILIGLMTMPERGWHTLGTPFTLIQFPFRLAGWLTLAIAVQLAASLRLARDLSGFRRRLAIGLAAGLVLLTVAQSVRQLYAGARVEGSVNGDLHPREVAFAKGPTTPPKTFYADSNYADGSQPVVAVPRHRAVTLPVPSPGQERLVARVPMPPGPAPVVTNVAGGPYVVRIEGVRVLGRSLPGMAVIKPPPGRHRWATVVVVADGGTLQLVAGVISILCLVTSLGLIIALAVQSHLRYRRLLV
jgi:hypothetical protein